MTKTVPFEVILLLIAILVGAAVAMTAAPRRLVGGHEANTILVVLVGTELPLLESTGAQFLSTALYPESVSVALVVLVDDSTKVVLDATTRSEMVVTWEFASEPHTALLQGRKQCMTRSYINEAFVLCAHACHGTMGWDDACIRMSRSQPRRSVLCTQGGAPTYSRVVEKDARLEVETRPMLGASHELGTVAASTFLHDFVFMSGDIAQQSAFRRGAVATTRSLAAEGIRVFHPIISVSKPASRCGMRLRSTEKGRLTEDDDALGSIPACGIVDLRDEDELIVKYGSVDAAHVAVQEMRLQLRKEAQDRSG